jgi:hypothetical protein
MVITSSGAGWYSEPVARSRTSDRLREGTAIGVSRAQDAGERLMRDCDFLSRMRPLRDRHLLPSFRIRTCSRCCWT